MEPAQGHDGAARLCFEVLRVCIEAMYMGLLQRDVEDKLRIVTVAITSPQELTIDR